MRIQLSFSGEDRGTAAISGCPEPETATAGHSGCVFCCGRFAFRGETPFFYAAQMRLRMKGDDSFPFLFDTALSPCYDKFQ